MGIVLMTVIMLITAVKLLNKHIALLSLVYYMKKMGYAPPNDTEAKECTQYVIRNLLNDLFKFRSEP